MTAARTKARLYVDKTSHVQTARAELQELPPPQIEYISTLQAHQRGGIAAATAGPAGGTAETLQMPTQSQQVKAGGTQKAMG